MYTTHRCVLINLIWLWYCGRSLGLPLLRPFEPFCLVSSKFKTQGSRMRVAYEHFIYKMYFSWSLLIRKQTDIPSDPIKQFKVQKVYFRYFSGYIFNFEIIKAQYMKRLDMNHLTYNDLKTIIIYRFQNILINMYFF